MRGFVKKWIGRPLFKRVGQKYFHVFFPVRGELFRNSFIKKTDKNIQKEEKKKVYENDKKQESFSHKNDLVLFLGKKLAYYAEKPKTLQDKKG